jgi:hypothetical protein
LATPVVLGENVVIGSFVFRPVYSTNLDLTSADRIIAGTIPGEAV